MAKFADVCAGIRARKPILLPLPGAQIDSATGEWVAEEGKTVPLDIRALREDEYQDVLTFAMKWAKKHGLESPEDGDPLYERAKMIQTLALTCIDKDSPKNAPAPFFDGGFEQIRTSEIMTPEVIGYLYLQQQLWQDEISPLKKDMTPAEFLAAAAAMAQVGDQAEGKGEQQRQGSGLGGRGRAGFVGITQLHQLPALQADRAGMHEAFACRLTGQGQALWAGLSGGDRAVGNQGNGLGAVLARIAQTGRHRLAQGREAAVAQGAGRGEEGDAVAIDQHERLAAVGQGLLQGIELLFDDDDAEQLLLTAQRGGEEVARLAGGDADTVEAAQALADGIAEIGAEVVVVTDKAVRLPPVAGGHGQPLGIDQEGRRQMGALLDRLEIGVGSGLPGGILRGIEQGGQAGVEGEQAGQGFVPSERGFQREGERVEAVLCFAPGMVEVVGEQALKGQPADEQAKRQRRPGQKGGAAQGRKIGEKAVHPDILPILAIFLSRPPPASFRHRHGAAALP